MAEFSLGQVVFSKQGKDTGLEYIVGGFDDNGRVLLIRPEKFNTSHMKAKNRKHLQLTGKCAENLIEIIKAGQDIDAGYFHRSVGN